ncbi:dynamin family protein [Corynebacterium epidermidicanis]|uniref:Dynamin family protein n=1 Tax=Corynebacterium epidermidicanis TaxID=1050174 RepID=A0A0G3GYD2_9CORY|nr:dynamin family protein [Corynebacterium epidermidicanis]AKK03862.1 dynamin family protein [Corynebacterium epidermidicanis]
METAPHTVNGRDARASVGRACEIATKYGHVGAAEHALAVMNAEFRLGTVVVVGEIKRGKSSVVNALVGRRDLLPVDVLMCTSAPIRVKTVQDPTFPVEVSVVRGDRRDPIDPAELPKWVTHQAVQELDRAPADSDDALQLPSAAEITVGARDLGSITIIDTPGVGGLDSHAIHAALTEARHAGVLLMVCDASTPITAPELEILRTAREQVGSVIVAVTKTDKNTRRWRSIVSDNRRLISQHLGLEIPVIGVSSLRALDAAELVDDARREAIEQRCGIAALRAQIRQDLAASSGIGVRTALDSMTVVMRSVQKDVDEDIQLHSSTSDAVAKLEGERAQLEKFREETADWEQVFQRDISLARNSISGDLDRALEQLRITWTERINSDGMRVLRSKPQVFTSQIETELRSIVDSAVQAILREVEKDCRALVRDEELTRQVMSTVLASLLPAEIVTREVDKKTKDLADPTVLTMGMVGAGALAGVTFGIAPLAAGLWIGINLGYKAMRNGKQHLINWLREMQSNARSTSMRMLDQIITSARTEIMLAHRSKLRQQQKHIQGKIEEARRIAQESETERKSRLARLQKNFDIIEATITELESHKRALQAPGRAL